MKAIPRLLVLGFCIITFSSIQAQSAYLHLDKAYYFHGEYVFYSLFLGEVKTDSAVLFFRLIKDEEVLQQHYHANDRGYISGYFKLPHELSGAMCEVQAFAFDKDTGEPIELFNTPISVFGEDSATEAPTHFIASHSIAEFPKESSIQLSFSAGLTQNSASTICTIKGLPKASNYLSIGIRKSTEAAKSSPNIRHFQHELHNRECISQLPLLAYKPQFEANDSTVAQSALVYAFLPDSLLFQLASLDPSGKAMIEFPRIYGQSKIQFLDFFLSTPVRLEAIDIDPPAKPALINMQDTSIRSEYLLLQKRRQIFQLFNQLPHQVHPQVSDLSPKLPEADFTVDVQDYAVKGKLADLFSEFVSPMLFQTKKGLKTIRIFYRFKGKPVFHKYPPLFIVNGVATQDVNFINSLLLQEVESIRIYSEAETLGSIVGSYNIGGLVVIDLIDNLFKLPEEIALPEMKIRGLQVPIQYPIMADMSSEIPSIQSLLYWSPHTRIDTDNQFQFQFPTTDLRGRYSLDMLIQDSTGEIYAETIPLSFDGNAWHTITN